MPITDTTRKSRFVGNGSTKSFVFTFGSYNSKDIVVTETDTAGTVTLKTVEKDYTVAEAAGGLVNGGTVTFLSAPADGVAVTIYRSLEFSQSANYLQSDDILAQSHEEQLNRLTFLVQDTQEEINRSVTVPISDEDPVVELPVSSQRLDKTINTDSGGDITVGAAVGASPSDFIGVASILSSADSAAARKSIEARGPILETTTPLTAGRPVFLHPDGDIGHGGPNESYAVAATAPVSGESTSGLGSNLVDAALATCRLSDTKFFACWVDEATNLATSNDHDYIHATVGTVAADGSITYNTPVSIYFNSVGASAMEIDGLNCTTLTSDSDGVGKVVIFFGDGRAARAYAQVHLVNAAGAFTSGSVAEAPNAHFGQLISDADCESDTDPPLLSADVGGTNSLDYAIWARSDEQAHEVSYSYKFTKNHPTLTANVFLHDGTAHNDMHGLLAGVEYTFEAWVYVPTSGGCAPGEATLEMWGYDGGWVGGQLAAATVNDAWEKLSGTYTVPSAAIGARVNLNMAASALNGEYFYVDNIRFYIAGSNQNHMEGWHEWLTTLDSTHFVAVYSQGITGGTTEDRSICVVGTVGAGASDNSISFGSSVEGLGSNLQDATESEGANLLALSSTKFLLVSNDGAESQPVKVVVGSVASGNVISFGTALDLLAAPGNCDRLKLVKHGADAASLFYRHRYGSTQMAWFRVGLSISGTSVTASSAVGDIAGSDGSRTGGFYPKEQDKMGLNPFDESGDETYAGITPFGSNHVILHSPEASPLGHHALVFDMEGNIVFKHTDIPPAAIAVSRAVQLTSTRAVVSYGTESSGVRSRCIEFFGRPLGISVDAVTSEDIINGENRLDVEESISQGHSGLVVGSPQYVDSDGDVSANSANGARIGVAVSSDEILLGA